MAAGAGVNFARVLWPALAYIFSYMIRIAQVKNRDKKHPAWNCAECRNTDRKRRTGRKSGDAAKTPQKREEKGDTGKRRRTSGNVGETPKK